jgi:hypothetical protein
MPTLTITPPALSPRVESVADLTGTWWVAQTRPQYEKRLARDLAAQGVDYFLPMVDLVKLYGQHKRKVTVPVLPYYVFVNGDEEARYAAATSEATSHIIPVFDQGRLSTELTHLEHAFPRNPILQTPDFAQAGVRCLIRTGHRYAGLEGFIESDTGKGYVLLRLTVLQASFAVEIEPAYLIPLN